MKKILRYLLFHSYLFGSIGLFYLVAFLFFQLEWSKILFDWTFYTTFFLFLITLQEFYHWAKIGRRSEISDIIAIGFFFFLIFFFTKDFLTSLMGAFSIYLWFGVIELKDYPIINKILIISLVTYNFIFIAGIISAYFNNPFFINTAFAFSLWIILGLGFLLFGRKYIVIWRFMSPAYLILFLYIIAWLAVIFINQYTLVDFNIFTPLGPIEVELIYLVLIGVNWGLYFISGPILDRLLGIKRLKDDEDILNLVEDVKKNIGIKGKVKVGFGKYPILNAMAYGSVFDKRIAIIAESKDQIPEDELKGIVAHELAHTKGRHTLILTIVATIDLVIRMILRLPATYYDYTFGNPRIPMISFIFLNIIIYIFIYIFVRFLEAKADFYAKKAGYAKELSKALYNLESFYSTSREFGLNTMLLSDEKLTRDNQLLDYIETAVYLNNSMIKPSRGMLLANFMNSHPPTYFRIAALLDDELTSGKEAILQFICLKGSKQVKYAKKFENARNTFKTIANDKFKEFFEVKSISKIFEQIGKKELYKYDLHTDFIFKNKITNQFIIGKLEDIFFTDDVSDSIQYIVLNFENNQKYHLSASLYTKTSIKLDGVYYFDKKNPLVLKAIKLNNSKKDGEFIFFDQDIEVLKRIKKTKLPTSIDIIKKFKDDDIFIKIKGNLKIYKCIDIHPAENFDDYQLELKETISQEILKYKLRDLIIRPKNISLSISRSENFRESEIELIKWLINNQIFCYVHLKKPVNNLEMGYIKQINFNTNSNKKNFQTNDISRNNYLIIKNLFGKEQTIAYNSLELITFEFKTAIMQLKSETSMFSRISYGILRKLKPSSIFYNY